MLSCQPKSLVGEASLAEVSWNMVTVWTRLRGDEGTLESMVEIAIDSGGKETYILIVILPCALDRFITSVASEALHCLPEIRHRSVPVSPFLT